MQMTQRKNTPVIRFISRNEETNKLLLQSVELACPAWGWTYLQMRADSLYEGDLNMAVNEVFAAGITAFVDLSEVDFEPVNTLPC